MMSYDDPFSLVYVLAEPECTAVMTSDDVDRAALSCKKANIVLWVVGYQIGYVSRVLFVGT